VFLAPSGSDADACTASAPCRSLDRGYHVAHAGQVVELAGGSYGDQAISADSSKAGAASDVVFRPASGATVRLGGLDVDGAAHLELRDLTVADGWNVNQGSDHVTFRNVTSQNFYITSASNVSVLGGSIGPDLDYDNAQIRPACSGCTHSKNIVVDGVYFHDATISAGSSAHVECLQVWGTDGLTVRNSTFWNCEHHNVFFAGEGDPVKDATLENNVGGRVRSGYYSFRIAANSAGEGCQNVVLRNNSATSPISVECYNASGVQLVGNVSPLSTGQCDSRYTWSHNVWDGAKCGTTDKNAPDGFVNAATGDLHLTAGSAAIDAGDPASYPAVDAEGRARPRGAAPDAGAYEF